MNRSTRSATGNAAKAGPDPQFVADGLGPAGCKFVVVPTESELLDGCFVTSFSPMPGATTARQVRSVRSRAMPQGQYEPAQERFIDVAGDDLGAGTQLVMRTSSHRPEPNSGTGGGGGGGRRGSGDPGDEDGNELRKLHHLMCGRYKWAVLLAIVAAAGCAFAGFRLGKKTYQSVGQVRVRAVVPKVMYQIDDKNSIPMFDAYVDSQIAMMYSQRVLGMALQDPAWQQVGGRGGDQALAALIGNLNISRQGEIVTLRVTDEDLLAAQIGVKTVLKAYQTLYDEQDVQSGERRLEVLQSVQTRLNGDLARIRKSILDIAKVYGSEDLKSQYEYQLQETNKLDALIRQTELALAAATGEQLAGHAARRELTLEEIAAADPTMARLVQDRITNENTVKRLQVQGIGKDHTAMQQAQAMLKLSSEEIETRATRYRELRAAGAVGAPGAAGVGPEPLRQQLKAFNEAHEKARAALVTLGQEQIRIAELKAEADDVNRRLEEARQTIEQLNVESAISGRLLVLSDGDRPLAVHKDTRITFASAGGFAGVAMGFGTVLLWGLFDRRLRTAHEVAMNISDTPVLGVLPVLPEGESPAENAALAAHCVHEIRTMLQVTGRGEPHQVLGVTSPVAGAGKTSLTLALGASYASAGFRTLIVDCDMVGGGLSARVDAIVRRKIGEILRGENLVTTEQLEHALRLAGGSRLLGEVLIEQGWLTEADLSSAITIQKDESRGVLDVLRGERIEDCIAETGIERLWVLPLGHATAHHAGQLSPNSLHYLITEARAQFDVVLMDTGPVPGSLEASVLASQVDGVVLIVSRGEQKSLIERSMNQLRSVSANVAGIVLNRAADRDITAYGSSRVLGTSVTSSRRLAPSQDTSMDGPSARFGPVAHAVVTQSPKLDSQSSSKPQQSNSPPQ
jgi:polysaccharide biosynthesis transport protein